MKKKDECKNFSEVKFAVGGRPRNITISALIIAEKIVFTIYSPHLPDDVVLAMCLGVSVNNFRNLHSFFFIRNLTTGDDLKSFFTFR